MNFKLKNNNEMLSSKRNLKKCNSEDKNVVCIYILYYLP